MKKQKIKLTDSESNSSSSNVEELDLCDDSSGNDSSSDESDSDSFLSDDGSDRANIFMKSIYEGSNLSVGTSCILITQFSRKYKLPVNIDYFIESATYGFSFTSCKTLQNK